MKKIALIILLSFSTALLHAQKLKITALDASTQQLYDSHAPYTLGKVMTIKVFDNSASVTVEKDTPLYLKKKPDGTYVSSSNNADGKETYTYTLKLNTTVSVLTSAELTWKVQENKGAYRTAYWKLTAKRF